MLRILLKKSLAVAVLAMAVSAPMAGSASAATEPTMDQVYSTAIAGKLDEAQAMMDIVLRNHPNSPKAHYVQSELLAKRGQLAAADRELRRAEELSPGLYFANPVALQRLRAIISGKALPKQPEQAKAAPSPLNPLASEMKTALNQTEPLPSPAKPAPSRAEPKANQSSGMLLGLALLGLLLLAAIIFFVRGMRRRSAEALAAAGSPGGTSRPADSNDSD